MRFILFFLMGICAFKSSCQNALFFDRLDRTEIETVVPKEGGGEVLNLTDFDKQGYAGVVLNELNNVRELKGRKPFIQDSAFNQMCNVGVKHFPLSFFRKNKYGHKIVRYTEFGLRHLNAENRLFRVFTFNVNLTFLNKFIRFFYVRNDETTDLKLFVGKRPKTTDPSHPEYEEMKPVKVQTEKEMANGIVKLVQRANGSAELYSRIYSHIGISIRVDEYTLNRKKIPRAFVMIILGGKQTQKATIKAQKTLSSDDRNNPYILLK